jgi:transposase
MTGQKLLLGIPERLELPATEKGSTAALKLRILDRSQLRLLTLDVDSLIGPDHKAHAIWDLSETIDLTAFYTDIQSQAGHAGRQHNDPRLLISLWLYAYARA